LSAIGEIDEYIYIVGYNLSSKFSTIWL